MDFLERMDFLNTKKGMMHCNDSQEIYRNILSSYVEEEFDLGMERTFEKKNWKDYRIYVHGMKSASGTIGATKLYQAAEKLEKAAKQGDEQYIMVHHLQVIAEFRETVQKIEKALE